MTATSHHRALLGAALEALSLKAPDGYAWFGERFAVPPGSTLVRAVTSRLYWDFYTQGAPTPAVDRHLRPARAGRRDLAVGIAEAASVDECLEPGWTVVAMAAHDLDVQRWGIVLTVPRSRFVPDADTIGLGGGGSVRMPAHRPMASPGHHTVLGRAGAARAAHRSRIYLNVAPEGAAAITGALTRGFDAAGIAFTLKVLADSSRYDRCDTAVATVARGDAARAVDLARGVSADLVGVMRDPVPALTLPLAPGLAYADDPPDGESFGVSRCRLIATAVTGRGNSLSAVEAAFAAHGFSLDAPYRDAGGPTVALGDGPLPAPRVGTARPGPADAAAAIGRRLVADAIRHEDRCTWMTADVIPGLRDSVRLRPCDASLYDGTAGIALVLAELAVAVGDGEMADTARRAISHAIAGAGLLGDGLHGGRGGVGYAAVRAGRLLGADDIASAGGGLLDDLPGDGAEADLVGGVAGSLVAALLSTGAGHERAASLADEVMRRSRGRSEGRSWPGDPGDLDDLAGIAHGAAGIGLALAEAGSALGRTDLTDAARDAFRYERLQRDAHGWWPDLRRVNRVDGPGPSGGVAWCHGAAGIAMSRARAWTLLGDAALRRDADDAMRATAAYARASLASTGSDFGLCHGLAGLAETLLEGARTLPGADPEWEALGTAIAGRGLKRHARDGRTWPCGPVGELPGLMTGVAGIALFLLRTVDPSIASVLWIGPSTERAPARAPRPTIPEVIHAA